MKLYVLTKDLEIGYIKNLYCCEECRKRKNAELTIECLDGTFMLQATLSDVLHGEEIIMVSDNKDEIANAKKIISKSSVLLCKYIEQSLFDELFKTD